MRGSVSEGHGGHSICGHFQGGASRSGCLLGKDGGTEILLFAEYFSIKFFLGFLYLLAKNVHLLVLQPLLRQQPIQVIDLLPQKHVFPGILLTLGAGHCRFRQTDLPVCAVYHQTFLV